MSVEPPVSGNIRQLRAAIGAETPRDPKADRRPMNWAELEGQEPPARTWRISHWLGDGCTLFAGKGGVGKTLVAQTVATALVLGRTYVDEIAASHRVLMWACEDDRDELWRRQANICRYFDVPLPSLQDRLIVEPRMGLENTLFAPVMGTPTWTPLMGELRAQVNDYQAEVVILDNIGQLYGGKEVERHEVTQFVNGLLGLTERKISVILLGHPARAEGSEYAGSAAWENAVRMRWFMSPNLPDEKPDAEGEPDDNVRYLAKRKTNYSVKDYRKLVWADGVFRPDRDGPGEFTERYGYGYRLEAAERVVTTALLQFQSAGIRTTDGQTSPDYLPKKIREHGLAQDFSKKDLAEALARMRLSGRVTEGAGMFGHYSNRMPKSGLVLAK